MMPSVTIALYIEGKLCSELLVCITRIDLISALSILFLHVQHIWSYAIFTLLLLFFTAVC